MTGGGEFDVPGASWKMPSEFCREDHPARTAEEILGLCGRMIAASKHAYRDAHPEREPVFNVNVCIRSAGKIWHGDLDLSLDDGQLHALADDLGETVYVLHECDARFDRAADPDYGRPAGVYEPGE